MGRKSDWKGRVQGHVPLPLCAYSIKQIPAGARAATFVIYYFAYFVNRTYKSLPPSPQSPDKPPQCDQITYKLLRQIEAAAAGTDRKPI